MAKEEDPMNDFYSHTAILSTIFGVAMTTYALRFGGLLLSERLPKSGGFKVFMEALPGTILVSLVVPGILSAGPGGWIAAFITGLTAYKTGNLLLSMGLGMAVVAVQRNFILV
jgi:branched chain amino acid efflux pump